MDTHMWHGVLKNSPLFYADRTKSTAWRQHWAQLNLWKSLHDPGGEQTIEAYLDTLQGIFQPATESAMAWLDFEARKQAVREPMGEYISKKITLYHASEPRIGNRNYVYLCQHVFCGVYSSFVKSEVICAAPADKEALTTALMTAVG